MAVWRAHWSGVALWLVLATASPVVGQSASPLASISLEELMNLEVTSVSRREQPLSQAPSAIYVVSRDDIRRSGATNLPDALRLVPGLQVARIDGNKWAVASRGFNNRFANKMLVLLDGRSVYTPLFSGVYWDLQDTLLEDVERIEVIRGPGATLWGANAVNGVINIITRDAAQTQGGFVTGTFGTADRAITGVRYGGRLGDHGHYRVYGQFSDRAAFTLASGVGASDQSDRLQVGTRVDWKPGLRDSVTVTADAFRADAGQTLSAGGALPLTARSMTTSTSSSGANVLTRWVRQIDPRSQLTFQFYYDHLRRDDPLVRQEQRNLDVEVQQHITRGRHDVVWGLGHRRSSDALENSAFLAFSPAARDVNLSSLFVQDEIALRPDRLRLTVGTKIEHNAYTQWEVQPGARLAWTPHRRQTLWASSSRAVRTPSRAESDVRIDFAPRVVPGAPLPVRPVLLGSEAFEAEVLLAHEVGYRLMPASSVTLDVALFRNEYDRLRTFEPLDPVLEIGAAGPALLAPLRFSNLMTGTAQGLEVLTHWTPLTRWRMAASWSYVDVGLRLRPESRDTLGMQIEDDSPRHQVRAQSYLTVTPDVEVDLLYYGVGRLPVQGVAAYHRLDARIAWRPRAPVRLALVVQNLGTGRHAEFGSSLGETPTYSPRATYVQCTWRF